MLLVDPQTGATRQLLGEKDAAWLNLDRKPMPMWLKDGRQFLWTTERNGSWEVELHSADGALVRAVTPVVRHGRSRPWSGARTAASNTSSRSESVGPGSPRAPTEARDRSVSITVIPL